MPAGDRTGPDGMGPMTGRGAGYCAGYTVPGYANPAGGRGYGRGFGRRLGFHGGFGGGFRRGFGGGFRRGYSGVSPMYPPAYMPVNPEAIPDRSEILKAELEGLQDAVKRVQAELNALQNSKESGSTD
ncbi:MAG TPA: DUF5320 domain-containing protein [bacterium]|nr:DUF5320 domain-containing protein [bacterium]